MTSGGNSNFQGDTETFRPIMLKMKTKGNVEDSLSTVETINTSLPFPENGLRGAGSYVM